MNEKKSILIEISSHLSSLSNSANLNKIIQLLINIFESETHQTEQLNDDENMGNFLRIYS